MFFRRSKTHEDWAVTLELPTKWTPHADSKPGTLIFQEKSGMQLTVGTSRLAQPAQNPDGLFAAARDVYAARMKVERQFMESTDPLKEFGIMNAGGMPVGFFLGARRSKGSMFSGVVVARGRDVVTFYLEGTLGDLKAHMNLVQELFKGLRLKGNL